jgi:hypothetical protein
MLTAACLCVVGVKFKNPGTASVSRKSDEGFTISGPIIADTELLIFNARNVCDMLPKITSGHT